MGMLILDRAQLEVRSEAGCLALYEAGVRRGTVPLKLVDHCVIQGGQTRLDSGVLLKLAEAGVPTVLLSPRQGRRVALLLGPQHNDAAVRLAQARRVMDDGWCRAWAQALVLAKLRRQERQLAAWQAARPDARKPLVDAREGVANARLALQAATEPLPLASLRGLEGSAARAHFGGLAAVLPPALGFAGRNRRPPRDPVNATLSLAYTLLHVEAVQALQRAGLDPLLGFYHRPAFGRESLACDLIEPLRPAVDGWLWQQWRSRQLREDQFSLDKGACLLGKAGREQFYAAWALQAVPPWRRWLRQRARLLARTLRTEGLPWLAEAEDDDHDGSFTDEQALQP
ncbi:MAG: hypothetical protein RLY71_2407 [Pseudomonadota bacterium]|jgi:CRISPR-associated protein Cas1